MFLFILKGKSRENQLKLVFFGAEIKHFLIVSQKNQLFIIFFTSEQILVPYLYLKHIIRINNFIVKFIFI
jgi:hypothetical protein